MATGRRRWQVLGSLVLALALVATACNREDNTVPDVEQQDRIIATASTTDDPSELLITWFPAPCESFDEVLVELDDQYANLTVRVSVDVDVCPDTSLTEMLVDLGEPLGDREVWDRAFGNTVALNEPPQPASS